MATTLDFTIGIAPDTLQPDQFPLESQKFAEGGKWAAQYARWIVYNFYNYNIRSVFPDSAYDYGFCNGILENFSYYYAEQRNKIFAYAAQLPSGESIPAPFIAGGQIRNFVDNINGNISQLVKPIGDSISAKNLDYASVMDKKIKYDMARLQFKAGNELKQLADRGIQFQPTDKQYVNEAEIDQDEESDIDQYEDAGIKISRSIYYDQDLRNQFAAQDGLHQGVGGICGTIIEHYKGKVCHTHVPSFNCIYDYRAKDDWGKGALVGGAVIPMTPEEILLECPDLTDDDLQKLRYMAKSGNADALLFRGSLNAGWSNITWWGNDGRIACVKAYWVTKRDLLTHRTVNSLGQKRTKIYDMDKTYQTEERNAKGGYVHRKGGEIRGEDFTWDVFTTFLIGNRWAKNIGYVDYVVRDKYGFPQLPFQFFSHNLVNGYSKSIVSRLRPLEAEYDRIMLKIREKMGRDYGRIFILNGKKMGISDAIEILRDWKISGVTVSAGDQNYVNQDGEKLVEMVDGTLENIQPYIQMLEVLRREMQQTVSISDYALGLQTDTVGKGVQAASVANSTLANIPYYDGMMTFWQKKLQYSFDLAKQFIKEGQYAVVVSETQVELLDVTKDILSKELGIYIVQADALNEENKQFMRDFLFNLSQNSPVMAQMGLDAENVLDLIVSNKSYNEGKRAFKKTVAINKQTNQQAQQAQVAQEQQANANMIEMQKAWDAAMVQFKEENSNYRNNVNAEVKAMTAKMDKVMELMQLMAQQPPPQLQTQQTTA